MTELFEQAKLAQMRAAHPDWIWNRSDTHTFVAVPGSHESFKTPVEPGNSFSPGPGTYGVSTWVYADGRLHTPEEKPLADLHWRWRDGGLPVLIAEWAAGPVAVTSRLFAAGSPALYDIKNYLQVQVENRSTQTQRVKVYLVVRSFGAAGGRVHSLGIRDDTLLINGKPLIYLGDRSGRFGALSCSAGQSDISLCLREGVLPAADAVIDDSGWASGALEYEVTLAAGASHAVDFACHVHAEHWMLNWLQPPAHVDYAAAEADFLARYCAELPVKLDLPDRRFMDCFGATLNQLYSFTVGDAPRISPLTYPLWWMRDCAYVVTAFDRAGLHDMARRACLDAVRTDAMTGFGGEADVPGEAIWMLSEHYLQTRDVDFLRTVWPFVQRKAELLVRARHTDVPIRMPYEFITHEWSLSPVTDLFCAPAQDGLIAGRMDHHYPLYWVNAFAYMGLQRAAQCAEVLGEDGSVFAAEAAALREALHNHIPDPKSGFGANERDVVAALWPCEWSSSEEEAVRRVFNAWWNTTRCPNGVYNPERLWTYFPVGEAHNYLLLGQRERTWQTIEWYFANQSAPGTYGWPEGERDENSALLMWQMTRGWDKMHWVTPTGWTLSEMFLLLRDCLVREEGDTLVLGLGVPSSWLDKPFAVTDLPTHFGRVSYCYNPAARAVTVDVERPPAGGIRSAFGPDVRIVNSDT